MAPLMGWRALDSKCDIEDIHVPTGCTEGDAGCQIWAGCNSTLGTGIEYSVDQNCYNYLGGITTGCNRPSNEKENVYNSTYGINNIWGKLYTWDSLDTDNDNDIDSNDTNLVCGTGYHVPSDAEWETLETTLNGGTNCRNATNGWLCDGLGWSGHTSKNSTNNMVEALQPPLAGYRITDGVIFYSRGYFTYLWSGTPSSTNAYIRSLHWDGATVLRSINSQSTGFSVRCIKD